MTEATFGARWSTARSGARDTPINLPIRPRRLDEEGALGSSHGHGSGPIAPGPAIRSRALVIPRAVRTSRSFAQEGGNWQITCLLFDEACRDRDTSHDGGQDDIG